MITLTISYSRGKSISQPISDRLFWEILQRLASDYTPPDETLETMERLHVKRVLESSPMRSIAAARLGIHTTTLFRKMKQYKLGPHAE